MEELLIDNYSTKPIDENFIKKEKSEDEEMFIIPGIVESLKFNKNSVKEELFENCISSKV